MAETDKELGKRLMGYLAENLEHQGMTRDIVETLKGGGIAAARTFVISGDAVYKAKGVEGLLEWVGEAWPLVPEEDRMMIMVGLMEEMCKKDLLAKVLG